MLSACFHLTPFHVCSLGHNRLICNICDFSIAFSLLGDVYTFLLRLCVMEVLEMETAINTLGTNLSGDILAWGSVVIGLTIAYAGIVYVQRILR